MVERYFECYFMSPLALRTKGCHYDLRLARTTHRRVCFPWLAAVD